MRRVLVVLSALTGCSSLLDTSDFVGGGSDAACMGTCPEQDSGSSITNGEAGAVGESGAPLDGSDGRDATTDAMAVDAGCTKTVALGPRRGTVAANVPGSGLIAWSSPTKALAQDGASASVHLTSGDASQELLVTGFGFTFPATAKGVVGIVVNATRASRDGDCRDGSIRLFEGGFPRSSSKARSGFWPEAAATVAYGGATDDWGAGLTLAQVSAADFGIAISAKSTGIDDAFIDDVYMTVHYCE